jgi:hypothetical protein
VIARSQAVLLQGIRLMSHYSIIYIYFVSSVFIAYKVASLLYSERWVLHSTAEYAENIIAQMGLKKPSDVTLRARLNFSNFSEMGHI